MEGGPVEPDVGLLPGIRRTVRASTHTEEDGPPGGSPPRDPSEVPGRPLRETPVSRVEPLPPNTSLFHKNSRSNPTATRHRIDTDESITTPVEEGDMESYTPGPANSTLHSPTNAFTTHSVNRFRRKLRFFFMNPYEKWKAKHKFPWKLVLQLIKVIFATVQLTIFGFSRASHVNFLEKSTIAFKHLYLENWEPSYETLPYPPATGAFAIYTIPQFFSSVNYAMRQYDLTESLAIGTYRFVREDGQPSQSQLCNKHYRYGKVNRSDTSYEYDSEQVDDCLPVGPILKYNATTKEDEWVYDIETFLLDYNGTFNASINFDSVIRISYSFPLQTIHLRALSRHDRPDCYTFHITITYENEDHDGQMLINLALHENPTQCKGHVTYATIAGHETERILVILGSVFDTIVIFISILSAGLCIRSIYRSQSLHREAVRFFERQYNLKLTFGERMEFLDLWYLLIVINDLLIFIGSIVKILIENKVVNSYELCGATLGTASLLVWFGTLRYLGFFEKYNVLILTLQRSAPNVLRFLMCAIIFYLGFAFCGWVVLGPYHMKFRQISTASECLFSLVNGDDMFVTFSIIGASHNSYVWYYSRIYLYLFIALFIYVVLSVFISVIMDAYETIKYWYEHGFPKSNLMRFVDACPDDPSSPLYRSDDALTRDTLSLISRLNCCKDLPCCKRRLQTDEPSGNPHADETTPLINT